MQSKNDRQKYYRRKGKYSV